MCTKINLDDLFIYLLVYAPEMLIMFRLECLYVIYIYVNKLHEDMEYMLLKCLYVYKLNKDTEYMLLKCL